MSTQKLEGAVSWTATQRVLFRIAFIFFILMSFPTSPDYYTELLKINWFDLHYRDFYDIARFNSGITFFGNTIFGSRLEGYAVWVITLLVSIAAGLIWSAIAERQKNARTEYNKLYYWLRVIVRYRAAIGIIGFGYTKLFPVQMPYPSLSLLNNDFGDLTGHKIYWLSIGISPWYQVFGGIVEVSSGILLMFRRTTTYGAALLFGALATITVVNIGYDGGVHVYASYFVLLAAFLLIQDAGPVYNLLVKEKFTVPFVYYPRFTENWQRYARVGLKALTFFLFLGLLTWYQWINFRYDPYKQPSVPGVSSLNGYFEVKDFAVNGKSLPYSPRDSVRWSEVTFEKWSSMTFKVNKPVQIDLSNGGGDPMQDINRTFELTGVAGGRRVFHYFADTVNHVLYLEDKNNPFAAGRRGGTGGRLNNDELAKADKDKIYPENWIPQDIAEKTNELERVHPLAVNARRRNAFKTEPVIKARRKMILEYEVADNGRTVYLRGTDENRDSVNILLNRIDKKYALSQSNLVAGEY